MAEEVPAGRCGFTLEPEDADGVNANDYDSADEWYRLIGGCACWRESWRKYDRCIWHADIADKPAEELAAARTNVPEQLDGAVLQDVDIGETMSFADCSLRGADLSDAALDWADLSDAALDWADLSGIGLGWADLSGISLDRANLSDAALPEANLSDTSLNGADLSGASLVGADLSDAALSEADLSDVAMPEANLSDAILRGSDLSDATLDLADLSDATLHDVELSGASLVGADLSDANLSMADISDAALPEANLSGAHMTRANLSDAALGEAILSGAFLIGGDLSGAYLAGADFSDSSLRKADFSGSSLGGADFSSSSLGRADLSDANLIRADLSDTLLFEANLSDTNLRRADLTSVLLQATTLDGVELDAETTLTGPSGHEKQSDRQAVEATPLGILPRMFGRPATHPDPLRHAEIQYRSIQRLLREHDLREKPEFAIREKHARRKRALAERDYRTWLKYVIYRWPLGYGERSRNVIGTSAVVILGFGVIYPFVGGMETTATNTTEFAFDMLPSLSVSVPEWVAIIGANLYFSAVTFTTLGYGDIQPATPVAQALASIESLIGALLMAFLVFVLGRRATW